ncbi:hypothetical protein ABFS82_04G119200 [Erythranthe guttata]|uniref:Adaptor protein ClpS core domain-containing protein n=1 Tax=Erythranthe guttata TaxID=4155 RepID=A0A022Q760_ERYGU|nr:PREDICTED: uncharacterized protein LOC105972407 [Erythranthe guttata]EYU24492.1 hypothetical protein MIMGU_mgv1a012902mg [Erythranthe guttata]|eukprot:XP_012852814.1 PREDICTED: uncharacterized protein LOC105972407 [Erythranthe guttata]
METAAPFQSSFTHPPLNGSTRPNPSRVGSNSILSGAWLQQRLSISGVNLGNSRVGFTSTKKLSIRVRIAEVKANERRKTLEEILYALVVQKFMDADVALVPNIASGEDRYRVDNQWAIIGGVGKGGGVLDKPVIEKTNQNPGRESEFDLRKSRKMSPPYRVMLHNDNFNKREYVVQVLMKVIPGMTVDNAVNIMQEAHINGLAVVIICAQPDAEEHCTQLRGNGLLSSIEPASGGC